MISLNDVTKKLDEFKAYCVTEKPEYKTKYAEIMQPLYDSVETYFNTVPDGMKSALENYVHETFCDTFSRGVKYEKPIEADLPTDFPEGYNDVRTCFYAFESLMGTTPASFFDAWVSSVPAAATGGTSEPTSNALIDEWIPEIEAAPSEDVKRVKAVSSWCANSAGSCNMINLLEDQGLLIDAPDTKEVAKKIYLDRGLLEVIQVKGYPVYVPTYIRGNDGG